MRERVSLKYFFFYHLILRLQKNVRDLGSLLHIYVFNLFSVDPSGFNSRLLITPLKASKLQKVFAQHHVFKFCIYLVKGSK